MSSNELLAENIKVFLRIKPQAVSDNSAQCLAIQAAESDGIAASVTISAGQKTETFTYDGVGGAETEQDTIFEAVARPVSDYCLQGYNGTIFAYGQTGSGKTFTMQGPMTAEGLIDYTHRGLIPRTFEYLFERIREEEEVSRTLETPDRGELEFLCKCSYVEIYNETIYDLLVDSTTPGLCTLREDIKKGIYLEGAREDVISNPAEAYEVYERGSLNRHVAETSMNRESSRSHSVFTLYIQSKQRLGEIVNVRESRFNLVDLAGSERQQLTGTTGARLKEAGNINKSLLAISNVINALVDISHGRARHVQYRDSRLTFLLRDSLGGNAKTVIVANVSSSAAYYGETLSTLKFAQRAKMIRNKAVVNKDIQGNVIQLQAEIQRLQHELCLARSMLNATGIGTGSSGSANNNNGNLSEDTASKKIRMADGSMQRSSFSSSSSSSVHDLDPAEAYLMLTMALERQAESIDEIESLQAKLQLLEEMLKRKDQQIQSTKMVLKFRENTLARLQGSQHSADSEDDHGQLKKEIQELRKIIEHHPEVTRFAYENLQLRERLFKYEGLERRLEDFETSLARHKQYEQLLTTRILVLERTQTAEPTGEKTLQSSGSDESIVMQAIDNRSEEQLEAMEAEAVLLHKEIESLRSEIEDYCTHNVAQAEEIALLQAMSATQQSELDKLAVAKAELVSVSCETDPQPDASEPLKNQLEALSLQHHQQHQSLLRLIPEREALQVQVDQLTRSIDREREHSKQILSDYETVKLEFAKKVNEASEQMDKMRGEVEAAAQKTKTAQADRSLLAQELEVTRQILLEYKARSPLADAQAAESHQATQRAVELEAKVRDLLQQLDTAEGTHQTNARALDDRVKILQSENGQLQAKIGKLEFLLKSSQSEHDELVQRLHNQQVQGPIAQSSEANDETIQLKVQLEASLHTSSTLRVSLQSLEAELANLRAENEHLLQHQNLKQKLQYHVKIKQENNELQEELQRIKDEATRLLKKQETVDLYMADLRKVATGLSSQGPPSSVSTASASASLNGTPKGKTSSASASATEKLIAMIRNIPNF